VTPTELLKALGDETRLRVACLLAAGELCVCDLEHCIGVSQSNLSRHLAKLRGAGLVASRKRAQWVYYRLAEECISGYPELFSLLCRLADERMPFKRDRVRLTARLREKNHCAVSRNHGTSTKRRNA
jgi:ArsR family transcriptional regulator